MESSPPSHKPVIILLGNYPPDGQESMLRFRDLLQKRLTADGYIVESVYPESHLGQLAGKDGAGKWLGYIDKYVIFTAGLLGKFSHLREKHLGRKIVVHICDHSNAVYASKVRRWFPVLVTCHDLLAVRGALGEDTGRSASGLEKILQKEVLSGLKAANEVVCVSENTRADLIRLGGAELAKRSEVIVLATDDGSGTISAEKAMNPELNPVERMVRVYEDIYRRI